RATHSSRAPSTSARPARPGSSASSAAPTATSSAVASASAVLAHTATSRSPLPNCSALRRCNAETPLLESRLPLPLCTIGDRLSALLLIPYKRRVSHAATVLGTALSTLVTSRTPHSLVATWPPRSG